jgi:hypothetical protein
MLPFKYIYTIYTQNGNVRLFGTNGKRKFVFLGLLRINGNGRLLIQQTCPTMDKSNHHSHVYRLSFSKHSDVLYHVNQ